MKVKCITSTRPWRERKYIFWGNLYIGRWPVNGPKNGDIVTVISSDWDEGQEYYQLKEWPTEPEAGWDAAEFVPLQENFEKVSFEEIKKEKPISVN